MAELPHEGNWEDIKARLIDEFPSLTEKDFEAENDDKLMIHLEQKLGKSKEEMREIIRKI